MPGLGQEGFQLVKFYFRRIRALEARRTLELADDRVKGAVGVMRRALVSDRNVRVLGNAVLYHIADTRLADARFAA